jgi:hypothetical protein
MRITVLPASLLLLSVFAAGCGDAPSPVALDGPSVATRVIPGLGASSATSLLAGGFTELQGSAVGPGGALFVTAPLAGEIWRVDPTTGAKSLFASGLPARINDEYYIGSGVVDVAFIGSTAYALVTDLPEFGGTAEIGIYRIDGPSSSTVVARIGEWSRNNPPAGEIFLASGYQFAIEPFRGGFLVTDGHHNRVLQVSTTGVITELKAFGNVAPTGLAVSGTSIFVAHAGPIPHVPANGQVVEFNAGGGPASLVAAGAPLLVDVEFGRGRTLFALSQGSWNGPFEGAPALPNTGSLVRVQPDGTFAGIAEGLDRPTSLEIIGTTAYVVTLSGEIRKIDNIAGPSFGR